MSYEIRGVKETLLENELIYPNVALIVNVLLLFPAVSDIQRHCLIILKSLYKQFRNFREKLVSPLLTVF